MQTADMLLSLENESTVGIAYPNTLEPESVHITEMFR